MVIWKSGTNTGVERRKKNACYVGEVEGMFEEVGKEEEGKEIGERGEEWLE